MHESYCFSTPAHLQLKLNKQVLILSPSKQPIEIDIVFVLNFRETSEYNNMQSSLRNTQVIEDPEIRRSVFVPDDLPEGKEENMTIVFHSADETKVGTPYAIEAELGDSGAIL